MESKGLIAASDGNVSCRTGEDSILITPSGAPKGELSAGDLVKTCMKGNILEGAGRPSSEIRMHLFVYRHRPDVTAIVHAHPPLVTAFTLAGFPFNSKILPEVWLTIGRVPVASYATPSTEEVPESIAPHVEKSNAILLQRHGALTFGSSAMQAFMRMDKLEHAAKTLLYASILEGRKAPAALTDGQILKLDAIL